MKVSHMIGLQKVCRACNVDYLIQIVVEALESRGSVKEEDIAMKLLCFGVDGVSILKRAQTKVM